MGTYTYVRECDVDVTDAKGLGEWLNDTKVPKYVKAKSLIPDGSFTQGVKDCVEDYKYFKNRAKDAFDADEIDLYEVFQETKMVGYWYRSIGLFLRDLAQYVEGTLIVIDENGDGLTRIKFKNGEAFIENGELVETYKKQEHLEQFFEGEIEPLSPKEKIMRKL